MASIKSAQKVASTRNSLSEILIDFIFTKFSQRLYELKITSTFYQPSRQEKFSRDDCQDVYDHFLVLDFANSDRMEIWAQTTCYKGNDRGIPEPNKSYEIRETLAESLSLRKWLIQEKKNFRTIHITLGPSEYTYGWFESAKNSVFDLSIYPTKGESQNIFDSLEDIAQNVEFEFEIYERLEQILSDNDSFLAIVMTKILNLLLEYILNDCSQCSLANLQAALISNACTSDKMTVFINSSKKSGMNIKGKAVSLIDSTEIEDAIMLYTRDKLSAINPFLPIATEALSDWQTWCRNSLMPQPEHNNLTDYLKYLWSIGTNEKYVIRRLLCRLYTEGDINYIQDFDIPGVTEHNLYSGNHSTAQVQSLCVFLNDKYGENGITAANCLFELMLTDRAKTIIKSSRDFEQKNGTSIKPSFFYIEEFLKPEFYFAKFIDASLPLPIGYYASFSDEVVNPYQNMKVIMTKDHRPVAIIKAKFFSKAEFPRRVKEEGFTGLTTKYEFVNGIFKKRYDELPIIMFIDMVENFSPPEFAIRRLVNFGWSPFFNAAVLKEYLLER